MSYSNYKVIVVDNGSTDGSCELVKFEYPEVTLLESSENLGFTGGNNAGIRHALQNDADYVLLLNNDTVVDANFLQRLVEVAEKDPRIGIIGPKIYFADDPKRIWYAGGKRRWTGEWVHIGLEEIDEGQYDDTREVSFVSGCAMMINRAVLEEVGHLDPDYYTYVEDLDFCIRVRRAGYRILFLPKSKIWHEIASSDPGGRQSPIRRYYMTRNAFLFMKKNGNVWDIFRFAIFVVPKFILRAISFIPGRCATARAMFTAILDFGRGRVGRIARI